MKLAQLFATRMPYVLWAVVSTIVLFASWAIDPYVFGFAAFGTAGASGLFLVAALVCGFRQLPWALLGAAPTVFSFALLSTYKWG